MLKRCLSTIRGTLLAAALLFYAVPASAQDVKKKETPKPVSIQEMVVTSTRSERSLDEVVAQVSVVDKKEIKKLPVVLWDDALKYQGGIWIRKTRDLSMASVMNMPAIRGVGGSGNNLLLLDGFPIMNPVSGWLAGNNIPSALIEQIELVKGPNSSLYGSSAMGGVMNIITQSAKDKKWEVNPHGRVGNYGYWESGANVANDFGDASVSVGYTYRNADNYLCRDKDGRRVRLPGHRRPVTIEHDVENRESNADMAHVRVGWDINENNKLDLIAVGGKNEQGWGWSTYLPDFTPSLDEDDLFMGVRSNHNLGNDYNLSFGLYSNYVDAKRTREEMSMNAGMGKTSYFPESQDVTGHEYGLQSKLTKFFADWGIVTLGVDLTRTSASWDYTNLENGKNMADVSEEIGNIAPYLQWETSFLDSNLLITPGIRADFHSEAGSAVSPKLGIRYKFNEAFSVRTSVGRSFRSPTIRELYQPAWMMRPGVPFVGNKDLKPATMWSGDLGVEYRYINRCIVTLTGFHSKGKDFISAPVVNNIQQYNNIDEVEISGFEAGIKVMLMKGLHWFGNYTYTDAKNTVEDEPLTYVPQNVFNTGFLGNWDINSKFNLEGSLIANCYTRLPYKVGMGRSATMEWENRNVLDGGIVLGYDRLMTIGFKATNITNSKSFTEGMTYGSGRTFWVEIGFTL
ncbi:MAG: TonB-dependent receptor [Deltaproteobacteria bacterium]|nr:TonB-dependent receptor [Deltaproteobacteria bacterium]